MHGRGRPYGSQFCLSPAAQRRDASAIKRGLGAEGSANGRATGESPRAGADRRERGGEPRDADGRRHRGGARARHRQGYREPAVRAPLDAGADVLLHLRRLGAGPRDERLSAVDQIPVRAADRRRVDARDALHGRAVAARLRQDAEGGVPPSQRRLQGRFRGRVLRFSRCATWRPTSIRSASRRSISAPRSSNSPGWRHWPRRSPTPT